VSYTTVERVRRALAPEIEGDDPEATPDQGTSAAALSDPKLQEFVDAADRKVDLFVGQRYTLPLAEPVDPILEDLATAVAAYEATLAFYGSTDIQDDDPVIRRYKDARGILGQLSTGLLKLTTAEVPLGTDDPIVINPVPRDIEYNPLYYRLVRGGDPYGRYPC
jgi:phage gp36-like protein